MVEAGTVLLNKYRIDRVLGQGGMGVVALAYHLQLQQPVAIKFLLPDVLDKPQVVQRFLREAQASVRLKSEHVCRVIDVGTLETGAPYMVMEYLDGMDLDALLQQQGRVYPGVAVDFVLQACEALAEAHALGIVHRDLKPSNFFLTRRPDGSPLIKVLDFGISKTHAQIEENLTSTQSILGTPAYMSPEQLKASKYVDARADIWSLGVVLYELLCGHRPFTASVFSELVLKVAMEPVPLPPQSLSLPPGLSEIVMCCLQKDVEGRYASVAELAHALAPYAQTPSVASSAVERTARILHGGGAMGTGAGGRAATHAGPGTRPGSHGFNTAPTAPQHPRSMGAASGNPSTLGGSSGEIVRPAPAGGPRGMVETNAGGGGGGKRKGWVIPSVVGTAVVAGVIAVAVTMGGGSGGGVQPAATAPASSPATPAASSATPAVPDATATTNAPANAATDATATPVPPAVDEAAAAKAEADKLAAEAKVEEAAKAAAAKEAERLAAAEAEKKAAEDAEKKAKKKRDKKKTSSDDDILGSRQ